MNKKQIKRFNRQLKRGNPKAVRIDEVRKLKLKAEIKAFKKQGLKSATSRAIAKNQGVAFQRMTKTTESKSICPPKSRYIAKIPKKNREGYKLNEYNQIVQKPREYHRLNTYDAWAYRQTYMKFPESD